MRSHRKALCFNFPRRMGFVDITRDVEACLSESGVREGPCLVNSHFGTIAILEENLASRQVLFFRKFGPSGQEPVCGSPASH